MPTTMHWLRLLRKTLETENIKQLAVVIWHVKLIYCQNDTE